MPDCYFYDDRELGSEYSDLEGKRNTLLISIDSSMKWVSKDSSIKPKKGSENEMPEWKKAKGSLEQGEEGGTGEWASWETREER